MNNKRKQKPMSVRNTKIRQQLHYRAERCKGSLSTQRLGLAEDEKTGFDRAAEAEWSKKKLL